MDRIYVDPRLIAEDVAQGRGSRVFYPLAMDYDEPSDLALSEDDSRVLYIKKNKKKKSPKLAPVPEVPESDEEASPSEKFEHEENSSDSEEDISDTELKFMMCMRYYVGLRVPEITKAVNDVFGKDRKNRQRARPRRHWIHIDEDVVNFILKHCQRHGVFEYYWEAMEEARNKRRTPRGVNAVELKEARKWVLTMVPGSADHVQARRDALKWGRKNRHISSETESDMDNSDEEEEEKTAARRNPKRGKSKFVNTRVEKKVRGRPTVSGRAKRGRK